MDNLKLVLFDLDGVLIESRENMEVSWSAVQSAFGLDIPFEDYFKNIGRPFEDILHLIGVKTKKVEIKTVYDTVSAARIDLIRFNQDCVTLVKKLRALNLMTGIVTSKSLDRTLEIVKRSGLLFDYIDAPPLGPRGKPNADPILRAILECQSTPSDVVYIGDMDVDYECAYRAGVSYFHANWGYGKCPDAADSLDKPLELLGKLGLSCD